MKIRNLLILGLLLVGFTYCSSDDNLPKEGENETAGVKMQLTVNMPTGVTTYSTTLPGGGSNNTPAIEAGSTEENKVNSVLVAIFDTNENLKATHLCTTITGSASPFTTEKFAIPSLVVGQQYYVYAFVNSYTGLEANILSAGLEGKFGPKTDLVKTIDAITKVGGLTGGAQENFFMSNSVKVKTIPVAYTHVSGAPLPVSVSVQRAVARMDYVPAAAPIVNYTYPVGTSNVNVVFTGYKLINNSQSFFNLKRVNHGDLNPGVIGGPETVDNYVVDTDWGIKITGAAWNAGFFNYMGETAASSFTDYKALTVKSYVTENTIPAANQGKKGLATAVVFKGNLVVPSSPYFTAIVGHPYQPIATSPVYVWNNKFYGTFDKLPQAIQDIVTFVTTDDRSVRDTKIAAAATTLASAGVTGYSNIGGDYPVYYVYYNRHNDNNDKTVTGPMEFAVVRNNIYKLTISSLSKFGHSNDPEGPNSPNPDPNPEKSVDPIESADLYMQVTATILDWTVRTNNIEF